MRTLAAALAYTIVAVAMMSGFVATATWLVAPDSAPLAARAAPPVPPRIAESIARKMARVPEQPRDPLPAPVSTRPAMQEADVSLVSRPAQEAKARDVLVAPPPNRPRRIARSPQASTATAAVIEVSRGTMPVATARSDVPY